MTIMDALLTLTAASWLKIWGMAALLGVAIGLDGGRRR